VSGTILAAQPAASNVVDGAAMMLSAVVICAEVAAAI